MQQCNSATVWVKKKIIQFEDFENFFHFKFGTSHFFSYLCTCNQIENKLKFAA